PVPFQSFTYYYIIDKQTKKAKQRIHNRILVILMKQMDEIYTDQVFRYLDHTQYDTLHEHQKDSLLSLAMYDALALSVSDGTYQNVMHLCIHDNSIVLGIPDARLPYINEGVRFLKQSGYEVIVRNSGRLAVALDTGVLNISLILA